MTAFGAIVRSTVRQLLGGRRTIVLSLLTLLPAVVTLIVVGSVTESVSLRRFHDVTMPLVFILVLPIVALVLGAGALGDERRDHTLTVLVLRPVRREAIVGAKLVAAWLATMALMGPGAIAAGAALGVSGGGWDVLMPLLIGVALSALGYVAVFLILGYVTPRAVLIGLLYVFLWENALSFAVEGLATLSLFRLGITAYSAFVDIAPVYLSDVLGSLQPGALGAAAKAIGVGVIMTMSGAWLLRRRDIA
jgi:ABC-2 type transport system permease protein